MLEEVCGAVGLFCLCPGAGIDPHADRRGLRIRGVLGSDLEASIAVSREVLTSRGRSMAWDREREAHSESVLERCRLGLDGRRHGSREASLHGKREASPASQALGKVQS